MTDRNNIEQLFKTHYARMLRVAVMIIHDDDLARDIVHDVFASLLACSGDFLPSESYLLKAVRNRFLNHIRDCGIHDRIALCYLADSEEYDNEDWPDEETIEAVSRLIATDITPRAREIIDLRFSKGLKFAEIAARLGISQNAVFCHMRNALSFIRKKINQDGSPVQRH